jgi:hypothetical protein
MRPSFISPFPLFPTLRSRTGCCAYALDLIAGIRVTTIWNLKGIPRTLSAQCAHLNQLRIIPELNKGAETHSAQVRQKSSSERFRFLQGPDCPNLYFSADGFPGNQGATLVMEQAEAIPAS